MSEKKKAGRPKKVIKPTTVKRVSTIEEIPMPANSTSVPNKPVVYNDLLHDQKRIRITRNNPDPANKDLDEIKEWIRDSLESNDAYSRTRVRYETIDGNSIEISFWEVYESFLMAIKLKY
jgi:hypothetical protein